MNVQPQFSVHERQDRNLPSWQLGRDVQQELTKDVPGSIGVAREQRHVLHVRREGQIRQVLPSVDAEGVWQGHKQAVSPHRGQERY